MTAVAVLSLTLYLGASLHDDPRRVAAISRRFTGSHSRSASTSTLLDVVNRPDGDAPQGAASAARPVTKRTLSSDALAGSGRDGAASAGRPLSPGAAAAGDRSSHEAGSSRSRGFDKAGPASPSVDSELWMEKVGQRADA